MMPDPAYRQTLRANSEAAVTMRVTSVRPKPSWVAAVRTILRVAMMSLSE
jgi:hypothetical protein